MAMEGDSLLHQWTPAVCGSHTGVVALPHLPGAVSLPYQHDGIENLEVDKNELV